MNQYLRVSVLSVLSFSASAEMQTVTLSVPSMSCAACPITVKKALSHAAGVSHVSASLDKKEAVVTFDDMETSVETLMSTTENAGYPSHVKK